MPAPSAAPAFSGTLPGMSAVDRFALRLGRAALLVAVALAPLVLAELAARRLYAPQPIRQVYDPFAYRIPQPGLVDRFTGRDGTEVTVRLNELGMRGPSIAAPLPADALRLVFLGGSTTEGYAYADADTFPAQVGAALAARLGRPVTVWNAGASAATSSVSLGRLQHQVLDLRPSLVVVMHGINDLLGGFHPGFRGDGRHLPRPLTADRRPRSYLLDALRRRRARGAPRPPLASAATRRIDDYRDFPARLVFARNLRSMAAVAAAHGVPILVLTQPTMYRLDPAPGDAQRFYLLDAVVRLGATPPDIPSLARGMRAMNDTVRALPRGDGVGVFDLASTVPRSWELFYDECHYTKAGNRHLAAALTPAIAAALETARP